MFVLDADDIQLNLATIPFICKSLGQRGVLYFTKRDSGKIIFHFSLLSKSSRVKLMLFASLISFWSEKASEKIIFLFSLKLHWVWFNFHQRVIIIIIRPSRVSSHSFVALLINVRQQQNSKQISLSKFSFIRKMISSRADDICVNSSIVWVSRGVNLERWLSEGLLLFQWEFSKDLFVEY